MPRVNPFLLPLTLAAVLLAGCGNKGPLVLPDQQQAKHKKSQPAMPAAKPAPGERKSEDPNAAPRDSGHADGRH